MEESKMIKLQMHQMTLDGKPLPETGKVVSGNNAGEVIEAMKFQSPFTADMTEREYIDNILSKIMPSEKVVELDATEFLTKLAEKGFLSFLPEEDLCPPRLMEVLELIRQSGATNMLDVPVVAEIAENIGEPEIADWLKNHRADYVGIVLNGKADSETTEVTPCADKQG